jgi:hypothetical protein
MANGRSEAVAIGFGIQGGAKATSSAKLVPDRESTGDHGELADRTSKEEANAEDGKTPQICCRQVSQLTGRPWISQDDWTSLST